MAEQATEKGCNTACATYIGCTMTQQPRNVAVITGDLVNSTALGPEKVERAFAALQTCAEGQAAWMGESLRFTRHRGDGWQVVLAKPKYTLRAVLAFRAALRSEGAEFDSYIGIAEGTTTGDIGPDLNEETAPVFMASGGALDRAKANNLHIHTILDRPAGPAATLALADHIAADWTPAQAAAIGPWFDPTDAVTYTDIARMLGKSRQAVTKAAEAAGVNALIYAVTKVEQEAAHA